MNEADLVLPRRLALQMLHAAQIAGEEGVAGVVAARGGPETFFAAPFAATLDQLIAQGSQQGHRAWAVFRYRSGNDSAPVAADFSEHPELLLLDASLATKGVLQLRAWKLAGCRVVACPMHVED
jgi:hypothetical protein